MVNAESDNRELIREVLSGNKSAFRLFVKKFERLVWHIVRRMVPNESDREDIAQDVFLKMYRNLESFRHDCRMSTWVARMTYNTTLNFLEKKKVPLFNDLTSQEQGSNDSVDNIAGDHATPADDAVTSDLVDRLKVEVEQLGLPYSNLVGLYHIEQMTYKEISVVTSLPIGTVKSYLYRARQMLKEQLLKKYSKEDIWK